MDLDLSSISQVREFVSNWNKTEKPIDILINNAGIMALPKKKLNVDGNEMQIGTNHLGHFLLTELLLPRVKDTARKNGTARIINVSSLAHHQGYIVPGDLNYNTREYKSWEVYGQSKLANILYTKYLAKKLANEGITVNALHPGVVRTELVRSMEIPFYISILIAPVYYLLAKTPWQGSQTTLHCALSDQCKQVTGEYFSDCKIAPINPKGNQVLDANLEDEFIKQSRKLVHL